MLAIDPAAGLASLDDTRADATLCGQARERQIPAEHDGRCNSLGRWNRRTD
jgi:hypothetical protein